MKKNKKAEMLYHIYDYLVILRIWINQQWMGFEHLKVDEIYQKKGFGAAFDYMRRCDRKFARRNRRLRSLASKRDHWFCEQYR